jgi:hypothetical protein
MSHDVDAQNINTSSAIAVALGVCSIWSSIPLMQDSTSFGSRTYREYGTAMSTVERKQEDLLAFRNKPSQDDQSFSNIARISSESRPRRFNS